MKVHWGKKTYGMMRHLKKVANGQYQLKWQGDTVDVKKAPEGCWDLFVNGEPKAAMRTFNEALNWVENVWGNEPVMTYNMLNREAGEFPIARKHRGGCCDPATETYHCM